VLLNPGDPASPLGAPGLSAVAYWITAVVLILTVGALGWWVWRVVREHGRQIKNDPYRIVGIATRAEVAKAASEKALLRRAGTCAPPCLTEPEPADVGYRLGTSHGVGVWASVEDSILLIGPPRSGKGPARGHPGDPGRARRGRHHQHPPGQPHRDPARPQRRIGPVAVFDPQHLAEGVPAGLRWSPIRGCETP
jgi:type IV secretion system protein VirD4